GGNAVYSLTLTNDGKESKVYTISVDSSNWADFTVSPSNVLIVGAGEAKTAFINVKPNDKATAGIQVFSATIKSGESVLKEVPLRANVKGGASTSLGGLSLKRALEIGVVILIILLVILALVIGFSKLRGNDEGEEGGEEKTYY
ncbi:MAG TPA: hypothetical protein VFF28_02965, partial [Candidatus Nanoarchaeia archaeon]|nr:hypothetical protein [Candidatus Nanoarchaeia archaeon]